MQTQNQPEITNQDTFQCAERYVKLGMNPVALDFASGSNPGGSWRSKQQGTQQQTLCKQSNLGLLLQKQKYPIPNDSALYIKSVTVTKNKDMKQIKPFKCAVIASQLRSVGLVKGEYLQKRFCSIYEIAIKNKHNVLILGAWGCGAFKQSQEDIVILAKQARKFCDLYKANIKIVFAIIGNNYKKFKNNF